MNTSKSPSAVPLLGLTVNSSRVLPVRNSWCWFYWWKKPTDTSPMVLFEKIN